MSTIFNIILATTIISLLSLAGLSVILLKDKILDKILLGLVSLSGGVLFGGALLHLLPESLEIFQNEKTVFLITIFGFLFFYALEQFILWHHCHYGQHNHQIKPLSIIILLSDGIHNFLDGAAIAAAFLINPSLGVATTIAVALHELPQEIGDFAVLVHSGLSKTKALLANFISALTAIFGGVLAFYLAGTFGQNIAWLLPFAAGSFIYISAADLIPEIKRHESTGQSLKNFAIYLIGVFLMLLIGG